VDRRPQLRPDYAGIILPANIAPLNFVIEERGAAYFVRIRASDTRAIEVFSKTPEIRIPPGPWKRLLETNRGGTLNLDVFVKSDAAGQPEGPPGHWRRFASVANTLAHEDVDDFIVYRRIWPAHSAWRQMGVYQRDLRSYDERVILDNDSFRQGCVNCHTFCNHRADRMLLGIRSDVYGSSAIVVENERVQKIGTKFGYSAWHPSGELATFSVNKVRLLLHTAANEVRDALDFDSFIAYYRLNEKTVRTAPALAHKDWLETYPAWSPDGRYLYFCCAPITWTDRDAIPQDIQRIRYSLMRVEYDVEDDQWGELETVLSANRTGRSILLPRVSPDGRWLLFTMCDYGCFPVYRQSSDLYLMDLKATERTGQAEYQRLDANSDASESWHSWSSNGRWIAFSSKRLSHSFTRTYLAYVDGRGVAHKPFVLPQQDPRFYEACLWTFSVPEFVAEPVPVEKETLARGVRGPKDVSVQMPITAATPRPDESNGVEYEFWHQ
jgi:hypothetical protein